MSDPLSVAASVVGLLTAAIKISNLLSDVISKSRHAPEECRRIKAEVDDIHVVLSSLQLFINGTSRASRSRTSLILVEQVVVTLASCVTTFSELDTFAVGLQNEMDLSLLDRLRWVSKAKDIQDVLSKLESHKSSLTLMLTILTCQGQDDAESKVDRLCDLVHQMLAQNTVLSQRLAALEVQSDGGAFRPTPSTAAQDESKGNGSRGLDSPKRVSYEQGNTQRGSQRSAFEEFLKNSRPYRHVGWDSSDVMSIISSAGRTASWSMLSGLSLSEISHLAVQAIPIYAWSISNSDIYDFNAQINEAKATLEPRHPPLQDEKRPLRQWRKLKGLILGPPRQLEPAPESPIFGAPLEQSVACASLAIGLYAEDNIRYFVGTTPFMVVATWMYLIESGLKTEDLFARNGNPVQMMRLQNIFDTPPDYGRQYFDDGIPFSSTYDAAGVLLRYLKSLPEPIVPYAIYPDLVAAVGPALGRVLGDKERRKVIRHVQHLLDRMPPVNKQLLFFILDTLLIFDQNSEATKMPAQRLISVFQPSILSGPPPILDPDAHNLANQIALFLLEISRYMWPSLPWWRRF